MWEGSREKIKLVQGNCRRAGRCGVGFYGEYTPLLWVQGGAGR